MQRQPLICLSNFADLRKSATDFSSPGFPEGYGHGGGACWAPFAPFPHPAKTGQPAPWRILRPGSSDSTRLCFTSSPRHLAVCRSVLEEATENEVTSGGTGFLPESAGPHRDRLSRCPPGRGPRSPADSPLGRLGSKQKAAASTHAGQRHADVAARCIAARSVLTGETQDL